MCGKEAARIFTNRTQGVPRSHSFAAISPSILLLFALTFSYAGAAAAQSHKSATAGTPMSPLGITYLAPAIGAEAPGGSGEPDLLPRPYLTAPETLELPREAPLGVSEPSVSGGGYVLTPSAPKPELDLRRALKQELEFLTVEHGFRLMQDGALRNQLAHAPFFHNWFASYKGYDLTRWNDGDNFLVSYIAHPMQGAVAGWIFLQNSPVGNSRVIGKDPQYWTSRLKAMAWAAAFEVQWKIGPLSETSIGNAGGWEYVPGCGFRPRCVNDPDHARLTNNTGLSDWIMTPTLGMGWIMMEDTIDKYIVGKIGRRNAVAGTVLRSALEPTRNFAALFNGVLPWDKRYAERRFIRPISKSPIPSADDDSWRNNRRSLGLNFVNISLPEIDSDCLHCRKNHRGIGFLYEYRLLPNLYFDSELNWLTGDGGGAPRLEGLFGAKFGQQGKNWGLFAKVRPGLIYYENAWSGGENPHRTNLNRFAMDVGGVVEFYPNRRSAFRIDFGTTLIRYLQDYPNPNLSPLGRLISTDYYVIQGNVQISTGYRFHF